MLFFISIYCCPIVCVKQQKLLHSRSPHTVAHSAILQHSVCKNIMTTISFLFYFIYTNYLLYDLVLGGFIYANVDEN